MGFFSFCHSILYWFYGERRNSTNKGDNWIDDDIYNRIIKFKAKNEIIKMNRNYSNVEKRIWTEKYVH